MMMTKRIFLSSMQKELAEEQGQSSSEASAPGVTRWRWREVAHYELEAGHTRSLQTSVAVDFTLRQFSEVPSYAMPRVSRIFSSVARL
jgi:hypothetical protein